MQVCSVRKQKDRGCVSKAGSERKRAPCPVPLRWGYIIGGALGVALFHFNSMNIYGIFLGPSCMLSHRMDTANDLEDG